ncbi:MAG TPA: hypothetical protein VLG10_04580 [Methylomirabilota bacterium]|nr:hypothetical protein [Methylomirabilota bacterium]
MNLLGDRYAPITEAIGFLEADFSRVVEADQRWRASLGGYVGHPINGALPTLLDALLPLTGPLIRYVWVQTLAGWTAYFDNSVIGSDPFGPVSYLAQQVSCRGVTIGNRAGTGKRGVSVSFSLYGSEPTKWLNLVRAVSAVEDEGRWEWTATGTVQPFEDVERYRQRRVRDRLTPDMLERYCGTLGIRPFDDSFYGSKGLLVEHTNVRGSVRTETLEQARSWHGLE